MALARGAAADTLVLRPTLTVSQAYDDNVRSQQENVEGDLVTTVAPGLAARYRTERGGGKLSLDLRQHQAWQVTDRNGLDRTASYEVDYMWTPRLSLTSNGRYDYSEATDAYEMNQDLIAGSPDSENVIWSGTGRYTLGMRTALSLTPSFYRSEYSEQELEYCVVGSIRVPGAVPPCPFILGPPVDGAATRVPTTQPVVPSALSSVRGVELGLDRNVTERDSASLRLGESWRDFERGATLGDASSENSNTVDSIELGWKRQWTPRLTTRIELGIERVLSDTQPIDVGGLGFTTIGAQTTLPAFDDVSTLGIGSFEVSYRVRQSSLALRYSRQTSPSVSYGTSLDTQTVSASLQRRINSRLSLDLSGYWSHQKSLGTTIADLNVAPSPDPENPALQRAICGPNSVEVVEGNVTDCLGFSSQQASQDSKGFSAGLNWQMTRQFSTFVQYRWYQRSAGGETRRSDIDKNVFTLGFAYSYDVNLY